MRLTPIVVAVTAALVLATAGTAVATTHLFWVKRAGVLCAFGTGPQGRGVACAPASKRGYAVTVTDRKALIWRVTDGKIVESRAQK